MRSLQLPIESYHYYYLLGYLLTPYLLTYLFIYFYLLITYLLTFVELQPHYLNSSSTPTMATALNPNPVMLDSPQPVYNIPPLTTIPDGPEDKPIPGKPMVCVG